MIFSRVLEPSRTYKTRSYDLIANPKVNPLAPYLLTIRQGEPHRRNFDCEEYAIQPQPSPRPGFLSFLLLTNSEGEVYETIVSKIAEGEVIDRDNPPAGSCTCKAAQCKLYCKHRESLTDAAVLLEWFTQTPERGEHGRHDAAARSPEYRPVF